jgi:hypothetical protein
MKNPFIYLFLWLALVSCSGNNSILGNGSMGAGTLGAVAQHDLSCSESELAYGVNQLLEIDQFKPSISDSAHVDWWKVNEYDFLNYRCIQIKKQLYMLTLYSESASSTNLSIRSYYSRPKKEWVFATDFSPVEIIKAEKAMDYLLRNLSCCLDVE